MTPYNVLLEPTIVGYPVKVELFESVSGRANLKWAKNLLAELDTSAAATLFSEYQRRLTRNVMRSANIWLRKAVEEVKRHSIQFPIPVSMLAKEKKRASVAKEWAGMVTTIISDKTSAFTIPCNAKELLKEAMLPANQWRFSPTLPFIQKQATDRQLDMAASALARLQDASWWEKQITKAWHRYCEHLALMVGKVRKGVSPYVSHKALQIHKEKKKAAELWLKNMWAINPELELEVPLADAVAASVANPELRRLELMVRMRGFEDIAKDKGFVGEFYTWTAPSRFHAWKDLTNNKATQNQKYDGSTPRQTQRYLCNQWAKARAKLARLGVQFFGFRVVEPHHDATPHWHLLLFVAPNQLRLLRSSLRRYAIQHDRQELGRAGYKARFDWKTIDPAKGSATGYIAKYVAKNIDGFHIDQDEEANIAADDSVQAVAAWASLWGIRQFQQIGGPSVTVWRELRRLPGPVDHPIIEPARAAADSGKWDRYVAAQGGIELFRKKHLVKLAHVVAPGASQYGEDITRILGLRSGADQIQSRHLGWEVSNMRLDARSAAFESGDSRAPWSSDNNCTQGSSTCLDHQNQQETKAVNDKGKGADQWFYRDKETHKSLALVQLKAPIKRLTCKASTHSYEKHLANIPNGKPELRSRG